MKKILATILSVILVATLAFSGTIAYLTDDESAVNVMTVGKVNIDLIEQQRKEETDGKHESDLEAFEDDKNMIPVTGNVQDENILGMNKDGNYTDKIVRVKNTGESPAWVRIFVAIPAALEEAFTFDGDIAPALHWNSGVDFIESAVTTDAADGIVTAKDKSTDPATTLDYGTFFDDAGWKEVGTATIPLKDGETQTPATGDPLEVEYNVYSITSKVPLNEGETTPAAMVGLYLDKWVNFNDEVNPSTEPYYPYYLGDKDNVIKYNLDHDVYIPVFAQAIQYEGFETNKTGETGVAAATFAFETAKMPSNPWETVDPTLPEGDPTLPEGDPTLPEGVPTTPSDTLPASTSAQIPFLEDREIDPAYTVPFNYTGTLAVLDEDGEEAAILANGVTKQIAKMTAPTTLYIDNVTIKADKGIVVTADAINSTIILNGGNYILPEGTKLLESGITAGDIFLFGVRVNGDLITEENQDTYISNAGATCFIY